MSERELVQAVKRVVASHLSVFAPTSSVPEAFWGALTTNESGVYIARGVPCHLIQRKEPSAISRLCLLAAGFKPKGSLTTENLIAELGELGEARRRTLYHLDQIPVDIGALANLPLRMFIDYGSSFGFTQIMGYHALEWGGMTIQEIRQPETHYRCAARLMAEFVQRYGLDPRREFAEMFRCWNTGRPDGICFSSTYVSDGLKRMELWKVEQK